MNPTATMSGEKDHFQSNGYDYPNGLEVHWQTSLSPGPMDALFPPLLRMKHSAAMDDPHWLDRANTTSPRPTKMG